MKRITSLKLLALVFLFMSVVSCSDDDSCSNHQQDLTDDLTNLAADSEYVGFAVSVFKQNALAYQRGFGMASVEENKPYTDQTTQPIGSVSKLFIGVAIAISIERGYFTLETNINDILPFEVVNPNSPDEPIRVKHLVTHTSGLVDNDETYVASYYILPGEDISTPIAQYMLQEGLQQRERRPLADYVQAYFSVNGDLYSEDNFAESAPGEEFNYSNIASSLTAYLIEVKSGQLFSEFVTENIFNPIGMVNTAYDCSLLDANHCATLYHNEDSPFPRYGCDSYPDGFVNTSIEDLGLFLVEMMKGYSGESQLMSRESYQLLFEEKLSDGVSEEDNNGIFWEWNDDRLGHTGGDPGVNTYLSFDPEKETGYIFLSNTDGGDNDGAILYLLSEFEKK